LLLSFAIDSKAESKSAAGHSWILGRRSWMWMRLCCSKFEFWSPVFWASHRLKLFAIPRSYLPRYYIIFIAGSCAALDVQFELQSQNRLKLNKNSKTGNRWERTCECAGVCGCAGLQ